MIKIATFLHHDLTVNDGINLDGKEHLFGGEIVNGLYRSKFNGDSTLYESQRNNDTISQISAHKILKQNIRTRLNDLKTQDQQDNYKLKERVLTEIFQ